MSQYTMTIDGKAARAEAVLDVINPATGAPFAQAPDCSRAQLDEAMESAQAAFRSWSRDEAARRKALLACAEALRAAAPEAARLLTQEQGKPLDKAVGEMMGASVWFKVTAGLEIPVEVVQDDEKTRIEVRRRPFGVIGAITPWNYPVMLAAWKIAPALLAGNTVVIKPSPYTPLSTLRLGEILRDVLPPGVLNVVSGGDALGAWITQHPVGAQDLVHGLGRDRQEGGRRRRAGPQARDARARRQRRRDRAARRRPRRDRGRRSSGARSRTAARCAARSSASTCTRTRSRRCATSSARARRA